jgi:hypothetical protein
VVDSNGVPQTAVAPCPQPRNASGSGGDQLTDTYGEGRNINSTPAAPYTNTSLGYYLAYNRNSDPETHLGVVNVYGERTCFFWGKVLRSNPDKANRATQGSEVGTQDYTDSPASNFGYTTGSNTGIPALDSLLVTKETVTGANSVQVINPPNVTISYLRFYIRPEHTPYFDRDASISNLLPEQQPMVTMLIRFVLALPSGEKVTIPYQTTVTTDDYGIPNYN